jgi:sugar transferase EpsL
VSAHIGRARSCRPSWSMMAILFGVTCIAVASGKRTPSAASAAFPAAPGSASASGPVSVAARGVAVTTHRKLALAAKRVMDVTGAALGIMVLSPVLSWTALAALIMQGPPILFRHERSGLAGRPFTMLKFRTMRPSHRGQAWGTDRQRITRLGRLLRSTSIDELPELWNVLRGDMSLVGPRPLLAEYLDRYTPEEQRRHDMRPGTTGWAAVNGRHTLRFEDRLVLDVWYVDNWSLWLDLKILALTMRQVLSRADVAITQDFAEIDFPVRFRIDLMESEAGRR